MKRESEGGPMKTKLSVVAAAALALQTCVTAMPSPSAETVSLFSVHIPNNMEKIRKDQPVEEHSTPVLRLEAARNEYEGGQLIVRANDRPLNKLRVEVSDLKRADGPEKISKDFIRLFAEHYIQVTNPTTAANPPGWYPDALIPLNAGVDHGAVQNGAIRVEAKQNQGIYVKVYVPKGIPAGLYTGELTLHETGKPVRIPIELTVWDFELTDESHTETAFTLWGGEIALAHRVRDGSAEHYRLLDRYYWESVEHRLTPSYLPVRADDPDEYVRQAIPYITNPKVSAYRLPFYRNADGSYDLEKMKRIVDLLREKGLLSKAFYYITEIDEPGPDKYPRVKEISDMLRQIAPDVRHFVTTQPVDELTDSVHSWVALISKYDEEFARDLQAQGDHVWWYTCVIPKHPYPSYHTDDDLLGARLLSWEQFDYGVEGTLYWSTTIFRKYDGKSYAPRDVWNDPLAFPGANGDGYLFYPGYDLGIDGPVVTLRMENLREAAEDYEYLWQLEQRLNETAARLGVGDRFQARDALRVYFDRLYTNMRDYPDDPDNLLEVRREIAAMIADKSKGPQSLVTVKDKGDGGKEISVYAEKGALVRIGGQTPAPAEQAARHDLYTADFTFPPGLHAVTIEVTKDGETKTTALKIPVGESYPYDVPLLDAETEPDAARWTANNVTLSLTDAYAANGVRSLKAEYRAGVKFPNIRLYAGQGFRSSDWSKYGELLFDVHNPDPNRTAIFYVKFHQTNGRADDTHFVSVRAGRTKTVRIPLREVQIDVAQIKGIELWMYQLEQPFTLYFDHFRLTSKTPGDSQIPAT
jgi:hypothetical protein